MHEDFKKIGYSSQERLDASRLITKQNLLAKYFFGNQLTPENKSKLGSWIKSDFNEEIEYQNMERSVDCWFRIGKKGNMWEKPYIDIRLFYNNENPEQSYIGVSVIKSKEIKDQESETFFFIEEDFEKIKDFIATKKYIFE